MISKSNTKWSFLVLIPVLAGVMSFLFAINSDIFSHQKHSDREEEEELESGMPLKDRMDLAIQQEFELTKDPALNVVPRERLMTAYRYAEQLRAGAVNGRVTGAIPGISWLERGPSNVGGRTRAIMVDPNDATKKTVWAAGVGGGLWKTTDITVTSPTWNAINDLFANLAITTIAYNPGNTLEMYFGTGEGVFNADAIRGNGIWKSTDGGATWNQLASTNVANFQYVQKVIVQPVTGYVYAGTRNGLFQSQNGGTIWNKVLGTGTGATDNRISDIEIAADGNMYVGIGMFTTDGVYKSPSGNVGTFTKINTGANGFATTGFSRIELACAPSNASVVYAVTQSSATNGVFQILQTTNGGTTWTVKANPTDADGGIGTDFTRGQGWYDLIAAVDPNNANTVLVGGVDIFKSTNGATSWQQISHWYGGFGFQEVHADQHAIVFEPGNSSVIYFGNDGGIWRTANGTATIPTIAQKIESYNVTQFYACAMNPTAYSSQFMAGAQDNGTQQFSSLGINPTVEVTGGDGCFCHIDQNQPQYQFSSYVYNNYYRSTNTGATFTGITSNNNGSFVNPTDYDDVNNNLYCSFGNDNYYVILNAPASGTLTTVNVAAFGASKATHISVSPNTSNRVFFGTSNGRIVKVDNANTVTPTATNITGAGMPTSSVSCIAVETGNDNHLVATYSSYGVTSVWETTNGGAAWTSVEGNLPDMPVRWALFNPSNNVQMLLATELGVWSTDLLSGGATVWAPSNSGLANVRTDMLQIRSSDNLVIAATHGRGLFSTDVFASPYPDFTANKKLTYVGKQIQFTDASYKSTSWSWNFGDATTSTVKNPLKFYTTPGIYTVTLQINGNPGLQATKVAFIQVLPNKGIPYNPAAGGNFDVNPNDFGAETVSGTPFQRGNSAIAGKNGTFSGSNVWVTGLSAATYIDNTDARLWTPNYNFTTPGTYTLKFYKKNAFEIGFDGLIVEYSLDKGDNWSPVSTVTAANWYDFANNTSATSFPINQAYFNVTKSAYTLAQYDVSFLSGNPNVAFRMRFKSDGSATAAGVAVDDFEIIGPSNLPLPVELASFTGEALDNTNELQWVTLSEVNSDRFEVERSVSGYDFVTVGTVKAQGTTSISKQYKFVDILKEKKNYYYRLKQYDVNGQYRYSGIIYLKRAVANDTPVQFVYPNPFNNNLNIILQSVPKSQVIVDLYDLTGKKVYSGSFSPIELQLQLNLENINLPAGTYLLKVVADGKMFTDKILRK